MKGLRDHQAHQGHLAQKDFQAKAAPKVNQVYLGHQVLQENQADQDRMEKMGYQEKEDQQEKGAHKDLVTTVQCHDWLQDISSNCCHIFRILKM